MTEANLAKTLEGLSAAATQGEWGIWREPISSRHDAIAELTEQVDATKSISDALVLLDAGGLCPASTGCGPTSDANAEFITTLVNAYRTGQLIVVDHPQATSPVDDRGGAVCEQQAVEASIRSMPYPPCDDYYEVRRDERERIIAAMPSLAAKDAEIARLREEMTRIADLTERWTDSLVPQVNEIARQALGDEA